MSESLTVYTDVYGDAIEVDTSFENCAFIATAFEGKEFNRSVSISVEQAKLISECCTMGTNKHDAIMGHPSALIHREFPSPTRSCLTVWPVVPIQVCKTLAQIACEERQTRALIQVKIPSPVTNSCSPRRDNLMKHVLVRNPGG